MLFGFYFLLVFVFATIVAGITGTFPLIIVCRAQTQRIYKYRQFLHHQINSAEKVLHAELWDHKTYGRLSLSHQILALELLDSLSYDSHSLPDLAACIEGRYGNKLCVRC